MLSTLLLGTLIGLVVWFSAVSAGLAVTVMSTGVTYDISLLVTLANGIAPFLGGFVAGWMIKKRGWVNGGWVGVLYSLAVALIAASIFPGFSILTAGGLIVNFSLGCVGGICGVNAALYVSRSGGVNLPH